MLPAPRSNPKHAKPPFRVLPPLLILVWFVAIMAFWWTGVSRCHNDVVSELWSPDGQVRASIFRHACRGEPTTGGVSVGRRVSLGTVGAGNVLRFPVSAVSSVSLHWESPRLLVVRHPDTMPVSYRATGVAGAPWHVTVREQSW